MHSARGSARASRAGGARGRRSSAAPGSAESPQSASSSACRLKTRPGFGGEHPQQLELDVGELAPAARRAPRSAGARSMRAARRPRSTSSAAVGWHAERRPPQQRAHAAPELADRERLRDVVVGAELEPDHLVELVVAGREHDDRHGAARPEALADLEPVELRQHQVEHDEVDVLRREAAQRLLAVARLDTRKPSRSSGYVRSFWTASSSSTRRMVAESSAFSRGSRCLPIPSSYYSPPWPPPRQRPERRRPRRGSLERPDQRPALPRNLAARRPAAAAARVQRRATGGARRRRPPARPSTGAARWRSRPTSRRLRRTARPARRARRGAPRWFARPAPPVRLHGPQEDRSTARRPGQRPASAS